MKTLEEIKAMRDELADRRSKWQSSSGCELMDAAIRRLIRIGYEDGFTAALELMLERERVAIEALQYIVEHELYHGLNQGKPSEQVAQETLDKLTKGEK